MKTLTAEDIELQKDVCKAYLQKETMSWLGAKALDDRANHQNPENVANVAKHMRMIDAMLLELFAIPGVYDPALQPESKWL